MKNHILFILLFIAPMAMIAQLESTTSLRINKEEDKNTSYLFSNTPTEAELEEAFPIYNSLRDSLGFNRMQKPFSMHTDNGLLSPEAEPVPRWFKNDKSIKDSYRSNQYLGDFKSNTAFVTLVYRDHEAVDGDLVRIFVNQDIVRRQVFLGASFQSIKINMVKGFNQIDILALNQGESGPNTAEFRLYDDKGNVIISNEWNLTTGVTATMIVVKE